MNKLRRNRGFTLIELLISLLIMAILLKIAIPSFRSLVAGSRVAAASREFIASLSLARAQAIRFNRPVTVCASNATQTACSGAAASWQTSGWLTFIDPGNTGVLATNANLLQKFPALPTEISFTTTQSRVTYSSSGYALAGVGTYTLNTPNCSGQNGRQISVIASGRPSITYMSCA